MIKEVKINKEQSYESKNEVIVTSIDMVLLLTDFEIFKLLVRNQNTAKEYLIDENKFKFISNFAMQPKIFDRKIKNMIKWARHSANRNNITDVEYDEMMLNFRKIYAEEIYKNAEPTEFCKGIPIMMNQSALSQLYILLDYDEIIRKYQLQAIVELLGSYAYRAKYITPNNNTDTLLEIIEKEKINVTSIYYDDISIINEAISKGISLDNICFGISDLSYNYELTKIEGGEDVAMLKVDVDELTTEIGTGVGMIELKAFDDKDKYFALG